MKSLRLSMSSLFLVAFMSFFLSPVFAQDVIIEENFDDGFPDGWITEQSSGNNDVDPPLTASNGWQAADEISGSSTYWDIPPSLGIEGNGFMVVNDDGCGETCDGSADYLISPAIDLTSASGSGARLNFSVFMTGLWGSRGIVEISTDGGDSWETLFEVEAQTFWQDIGLSLDPYTDSSEFHVRFWHDDSGNWASGCAIDNFSITTPVAFDMRIDRIQTPNDYAYFPISEWANFGDFTIDVTNNGAEDRTEVTMLMTIQYNDFEANQLTTVGEFTGEPSELASGETQTFTIPNTFEPADTGTYIFNYFISSAEDDEELNGFDNLKVFTSSLTTGKYGRAIDFVDIVVPDEEGNATLDFSFTVFTLAGTGAYGSSIEAFEDSQLAGITFDAVGPESGVWGETELNVYNMTEEGVGEVFYTFGPFIPEADTPDGGTFTTTFDCPIELPTGKYFISVEPSTPEGELGMACSTQRNTPGESLTLNAAGNWVGTGVSSGAVIPMVYGILASGPATSITYAYEVNGLSVDLTGQADGTNCDWSWDFGNGETAEGSTATAVYAESGTYTICVFGTDGLEHCEDILVECNIDVNVVEEYPTTLTVSPSGGAGDYTFDWAGLDQDSETITDLTPGTSYSVVVSDESGCVSEEIEVSTPDCSLEFEMGQEDLGDQVQWFIDSVDNPFSEPVNHEVVWSSDAGELGSGLILNVDVADLEQGGNYTVTLTDEFGCESSMDFTVIEFSTSVTQVEGLQTFEFYPNPSQGIVQVGIELDHSVAFTLSVFDVAGELVHQTSQNDMRSFSQELDLSDLPAGVYMVQFAFDSAVATERLVISK